MALCLLCKNDVAVGYVVCGECASQLKSNTMPHILDYYIARLAAKIAFDDTVYPCPMCEIENCCLGKEESDRYKCHKGISDWLRSMANEFFETAGDSILSKLKTVDPFPEVIKLLDTTAGQEQDGPSRKIGYIRARFENSRWEDTGWPSYGELAAGMKAEINRTYEALIAKDALHDLTALRRFCWLHPEAQQNPEADDEFNFYLVGVACNFWVRLNTSGKDYSIYLSAYAKADDEPETR